MRKLIFAVATVATLGAGMNAPADAMPIRGIPVHRVCVKWRYIHHFRFPERVCVEWKYVRGPWWPR